MIPPTIITDLPEYRECSVGEATAFAVVATGTGPLKYQWLKNGTPINGEVSATYTLSSVKTQDAGTYSVRISGPSRSVASGDSILVVKPGKVTATIIDQPVSITKKVGAKATFTVRATGTGILKYQWYKNGRKMEGETSRSLTINKVALSSAGNYHVVVKNAIGQATSKTAVLKVTK